MSKKAKAGRRRARETQAPRHAAKHASPDAQEPAPAPVVAPEVVSVQEFATTSEPSAEPAGDPALGSMIQINAYSDMTRSSLLEFAEEDGQQRVIMVPQAAEPVSSTRVPLSELEVVEASAGAAMTAASTAAQVAATAATEVRVTGTTDEQLLMRHQVGDALRDVSTALARLAESLDPR